MTGVTVAALAAEKELGLRLLSSSGDGAAAVVASAHVSDLPHPSRYVLPGELLLTNGLWLATTAASEWAREVQQAGAVGIGFGLNADQRTVPSELRQACDALELPLLVVPEDVSFSLVADLVHASTTDQEAATLRRQLLRTRRLVQRIAEGGGRAALLELVAAESGLSAAFVGPGGRVLATTGVPPKPETARRAALAALHGALPSTVGQRASVFGVSTRAPGSALVVRAPLREIADDARLLLEQVAAYGAFDDARERALEDARRAMADELVALVLADEIGDAAFAARLRSLKLDPERPVTPIACDVPIEALSYAVEFVGAPYALSRHQESQLLLVQAEGEGAVGQLAEAIVAAGANPALGCATPACGAGALRRSIVEALAALRLALARTTGERLVHETEIGSHELLLELLEPSQLDAYRRAVLGRLEDWDREHGSTLVETLRTFLALGGHWREAAAKLHIHHNTLRYRLDRVEELTGRRLARTDERVDLFLALAALDRSRAHDRSGADGFVQTSTTAGGFAPGS